MSSSRQREHGPDEAADLTCGGVDAFRNDTPAPKTTQDVYDDIVAFWDTFRREAKRDPAYISTTPGNNE